MYGTVGVPESAYDRVPTNEPRLEFEVAKVAIVGKSITASTKCIIPLVAAMFGNVTVDVPLKDKPSVPS